MNTQPAILVFAQSENWCAAIRRTFENRTLSWVLCPEGLIEESCLGKAAVAIVEIPSQNPEAFCKTLSQLSNNPFNLTLMAVGNGDLSLLAPLLIASGFAAWFDSFLQLPDLKRTTLRSLAFAHPPHQSLETATWNQLPWAGS